MLIFATHTEELNLHSDMGKKNPPQTISISHCMFPNTYNVVHAASSIVFSQRRLIPEIDESSHPTLKFMICYNIPIFHYSLF